MNSTKPIPEWFRIHVPTNLYYLCNDFHSPILVVPDIIIDDVEYIFSFINNSVYWKLAKYHDCNKFVCSDGFMREDAVMKFRLSEKFKIEIENLVHEKLELGSKYNIEYLIMPYNHEWWNWEDGGTDDMTGEPYGCIGEINYITKTFSFHPIKRAGKPREVCKRKREYIDEYSECKRPRV